MNTALLLLIFQHSMKHTVLFALTSLSCLGMGAQNKEAIRLNQVGHFPLQEKYVVVDGKHTTAEMTVTDDQGRVVVQKAPTRTVVSPWSGKKRTLYDLSELQNTGLYTVKVDRLQAPLTINDRPFHSLALASLRSFYLIRSGIDISKELGGVYARKDGHPDTKVYIHPSAVSPGRPAESVISSPYGWYDAGDYNKYVVNSSFTIGLILQVYQQIPQYFQKLNTNIPESNNQTPDLLDEMMFNLKWLLTMQDPADGGVYHKLTTPQFESFVMPTECHQKRYVVAKSVTAALDFAAVMAMSARLFQGNKDYPQFSAQARTAAQKAYAWALKNPSALYQQAKMNLKFTPQVATGEYGDNNAQDEKFWAATELYLLTGKKTYRNDALALFPATLDAPSWATVATLGQLSWLQSKDSALKKRTLQQLQRYCDQLISQVSTSNFQAPYGDKATDFGWGCLGGSCCTPGILLLFADRYVQPSHYFKYALQNLDYLLGRNATGYCYVTGFGNQRPMHPHHRISAADGITEPFPGLLVGGPNPMQQDKASDNLVYPSNHPDESYLDEQPSYASNEIAINWNAALVGLACWIDASAAQ